MKLLLFFLWRDAEDGDLVLGWGKSKGYGRLKLVDSQTSWQSWAEQMGTASLEHWESNLLEELGIEEQLA